MKTIPSGLKLELYKLYTKPIHFIDLYLDEPYSSPSHHYCVNNKDIVFAGVTYTAIAAKRGSIVSEESTILQDLEVSLDNIDLEFRQQIASGKFRDKRVVIFIGFQGFFNDGNNKIILFDGEIDNASGDDEFLVLSIAARFPFEREYPRRIYQSGCNWTFGDENCGISLEDYRDTYTIQSLSTQNNLIVGSTNHDDNYFYPGYAQITSGPMLGEVKPILTSTSDTIYLRLPLSEVPSIGTTFIAQKLCEKNPVACKDIFDNYDLNYGGFPFVPRQPKL